MTASHIPGATWVVVADDAELRTRVPALSDAKEPGGDEPDDPVRPCDDSCLHLALAAVQRAEPVALLLSETKELLQVRFPSTGHVSRCWQDGHGLRFTLRRSQVVFTLPPDEHALASRVTNARETNTGLLVVDAAFDGVPTLIQRWDRTEADGFCDTFEVNPGSLTLLSKAAANALYKAVFALNSKPPYTEGIPFRWSHSYCEAKAQGLRAVLRTIGGIRLAKAWAMAKPDEALEIVTTSRRSCVEHWAYHVGVIVRAAERDVGFWVFDPTVSLEAGVLSFDAWKAAFGSGLDDVQLTKGTAYQPCDLSELTFQAEEDGEMPEGLTIARCQLACLAEEQGHPPFPCSDNKHEHAV